MIGFWRDLRLALRQMRNTPGLSVVAVLSIALGLAGTAVVVNVLAKLLLRSPAGVEAPREVRRLYVVRDEGTVRTPDGGPGSYLDYQVLREGIPGVASVATYLAPEDHEYRLGAAVRQARGQAVSGELFSLLGVRPSQGRLLASDAQPPAELEYVVVLSHAFWEREFASNPEAIGRPLMLDGTPYTVIGVAASDFMGIEAEPVDLWFPLSTAADDLLYRPEVALFEYLLRLDPAVEEGEVLASIQGRLAGSAADHPKLDPSPTVLLGPLNSARGPHSSGVLRLTLSLGVATAMLLCIASANFASLLLARAAARRRELAVRRALGAGEQRLSRQLVTESVALSLLGGLAGTLLAVAVSAWVERLPEVPAGLGIDPWMAAFAFCVSLATGLFIGLIVSVRSRGMREAVTLNQSQPVGDQVSGRLPAMLVAGQVALAVVLLAGAGIFFRSLQKVVTIDTGLDLDRLAVVSMDLVTAGFGAPEMAAIHERSLERLEALVDVEAATMVLPLPLSGRGWGMTVEPRGKPVLPLPEGPYAYVVGPDFFRTTGIPIVAGRTFSAHDRAGSEPVAIVSRALAVALEPSRSAVGTCVIVGPEQRLSGGCTRIVGVAENIRHRYLLDQPVAYVYLPQSQVGFDKVPSMFQPDLLVRTVGDPGTHLGAFRSALQSVVPDLSYVEVQSFASFVGQRTIRPFRITALLLGVFGALALLMATIGLYGTISQFVAARGREVGVRMALGASRSMVLRQVLKTALIPVASGLALGLVAAAAVARLIGTQMHGLTVRDPVTAGLVVVALAMSGVAGAWLPARRAANVDPLVAFRGDSL